MTNNEAAEYIAKQIQDAELHCPRCLKGYTAVHELILVGDNPDILFCPHCNLTVQLVVTGSRP